MGENQIEKNTLIDDKNYIGTNIKNILKAREIDVKDFSTKLNLKPVEAEEAVSKYWK